jgi:hypothetical protein
MSAAGTPSRRRRSRHSRSWFKRRILAVTLTVGGAVFMIVALGLIAFLPAALAESGLSTSGRIIAGVLRWVLLLFGMVASLSVLYRFAPHRDEPEWRWALPGAIAATVIWISASLLFSLYTANFAKYNETYGTLGAVVVVMLWLFLTAFAVIVGAELNAELERQTSVTPPSAAIDRWGAATRTPPTPSGQLPRSCAGRRRDRRAINGRARPGYSPERFRESARGNPPPTIPFDQFAVDRDVARALALVACIQQRDGPIVVQPTRCLDGSTRVMDVHRPTCPSPGVRVPRGRGGQTTGSSGVNRAGAADRCRSCRGAESCHHCP